MMARAHLPLIFVYIDSVTHMTISVCTRFGYLYVLWKSMVKQA
jgi:hypothetical protein